MAQIEAIYIAERAGAPMQSVASAALERDRGIVGDRYHASRGQFSRQLEQRDQADWHITLIELEEIDAFLESEQLALNPGDFRRNVVTRGVRLNPLVGQAFTLDGVALQGVRLCEPCAYLARLVSDKVLPGLVGKCGLRARVVSSGTIQTGGKLTLDSGQALS